MAAGRRAYIIMVAIALIGAAFAVALSWREHAHVMERERLAFEQKIDAHLNALSDHLQEREGAARAIAAVFRPQAALAPRALGNIDAEFLRLVPDITSVVWVPRFVPEQAGEVLAALRAMDVEPPLLLTAERKRVDQAALSGESAVVLDIEPKSAANVSSLGLLISTLPHPRAALERARRTRDVAATAPLRLVQMPEALALVLYAPIYTRAVGTERELSGYLGFSYRFDALITAAATRGPPAPPVRIVDAGAPDAGEIFKSPAFDRIDTPAMTRTVEFGGRAWSLAYKPHTAPEEAAWRQAMQTGASALAGVALLLGLAAYIASVNRRLEGELAARLSAEQRLHTLIGELNHRVKNILTIVQAVARQTLTPDIDVNVARENLVNRLHAMSNATTLLSQREFHGVALRELVLAAGLPISERVSIEGPDLELAPQAAQNMALLVHELWSNAVKYGALSVESGRAALAWSVADGEFRLAWRESGGPKVREPNRRGFGRRLIEQVVPAGLGGSGKLSFAESGLDFELRAPISDVLHR